MLAFIIDVYIIMLACSTRALRVQVVTHAQFDTTI